MSDGAGEDFPFEEFLNLSSDDEPQPPHFPSSSSLGHSKRQRTTHDYVAGPPLPSNVFQETVDRVIRLSTPLPFPVSQGTLKGTAAAMDQLSAHAQLYQLLSPPYGNFHWFCELSLLIHRIKGFLMSAPTANTCGFIETGKKGWRYRCNSKVCQPQPCPVLKENMSSHLLLLLLQFVEAMLRNPIVFEASQIVTQLKVSTECHLAKLGPYSLRIPLELTTQLAEFILSLRQPIIPTPRWPDLSTRTPLRQRPVFPKGLEDQLDMEALDKFLHPELEAGNHVAILFYCENYTHFRNNEFCQNDIKALSMTLQNFFGYEVTACCVEQSQEVIAKTYCPTFNPIEMSSSFTSLVMAPQTHFFLLGRIQKPWVSCHPLPISSLPSCWNSYWRIISTISQSFTTVAAMPRRMLLKGEARSFTLRPPCPVSSRSIQHLDFLPTNQACLGLL